MRKAQSNAVSRSDYSLDLRTRASNETEQVQRNAIQRNSHALRKRSSPTPVSSLRGARALALRYTLSGWRLELFLLPIAAAAQQQKQSKKREQAKCNAMRKMHKSPPIPWGSRSSRDLRTLRGLGTPTRRGSVTLRGPLRRIM